MSTHAVATDTIEEYVGKSISVPYDGEGNWPVVGTGYAGLTLTGTIRHTASSDDILYALLSGDLVVSGNILTVSIDKDVVAQLGVGNFSLGVSAVDGDGFAFAVLDIRLVIKAFADRP